MKYITLSRDGTHAVVNTKSHGSGMLDAEALGELAATLYAISNAKMFRYGCNRLVYYDGYLCQRDLLLSNRLYVLSYINPYLEDNLYDCKVGDVIDVDTDRLHLIEEWLPASSVAGDSEQVQCYHETADDYAACEECNPVPIYACAGCAEDLPLGQFPYCNTCKS